MTTPSQLLWRKKYQPSSLDDYVWNSDAEKKQFQQYIDKGELPHLLLVGQPGVGKTSLALLLMHLLKVDPSDVLFVKASSSEGSKESVNTTISNFITSSSWSDSLKYVIMDEADGISHEAQKTLRSEIDTYEDSTRWIFTANYEHRIIPALKDRVVVFERSAPNRDEYLRRCIEILQAEGVRFETDDDLNILTGIVDKCYPSMRNCINTLQDAARDGVLHGVASADADAEWKGEVFGLFLDGDILAARQKITANATKTDIEEYYTWLVSNLEVFKDQGAALIEIADGMYRHAFAADPEINLSATMVKLCRLPLIG